MTHCPSGVLLLVILQNLSFEFCGSLSIFRAKSFDKVQVYYIEKVQMYFY